jgi:nucleoside-diphosphate-sugar epimerase
MRVFVAGATGVIGQFLVPGLISAGHEVTASTRSALKANQLKGQGATPVVVDGLDREAVLKAVTAAQPEVIVHQMTSLTSMKSFRNFDKEFAVTNELRSTGTDHLLAAAREAGTRRFIAQSFTGWNNTRAGSQVKTEQDPLDPRSLAATTKALAAIKHLEDAVPARVPEGLVLRYGILYGHGASDLMLDAVRKRQLPRRPGPLQRRGRRAGPGLAVAALPGLVRGREAAPARPGLAGPAARRRDDRRVDDPGPRIQQREGQAGIRVDAGLPELAGRLPGVGADV